MSILLKKYQNKIIQELPKDKKKIAEKTFLELKENFDSFKITLNQRINTRLLRLEEML